MSVISTALTMIRPQTPAEELRLEMAQRAERAYERALRMRKFAVLLSLAVSLVQCACSNALAPPAPTDGLSPSAVVWGVPLLASFFTMALVWSCRMNRDQCLDRYTMLLKNSGLFDDEGNKAVPTS